MSDLTTPHASLSNQRISLPKDRIRILLLEGVSDTAVGLLGAAGYSNIQRETRALEGKALMEALAGVHLLGIRSRTQLTAEALAAADRLIAVAASASAPTRWTWRRPSSSASRCSTRPSATPAASPSW